MKPSRIRNMKSLLPAAMFLACCQAYAVDAPRVMFVSKIDAQPVIVDLQGRELPARKGMVVPPGYTVKVPEGATLQLMTQEKAIVAVRPNSLLKFEDLGDMVRPYKVKLDVGGLRVANSDKQPHKFEVDTPNAKLKFGKGDHEAYYLKQGKLKDGRWGTFGRTFKEDMVLTTTTGDTTITRKDVGYVPGTVKDKVELIARVDVNGKITNPVSYVPGAREIGTTEMVQNFDVLEPKASITPPTGSTVPPSTTLPPLTSKSSPVPEMKSYAAPPKLQPPPVTTPIITPVASLEKKLAVPDLKNVAGISTLKPVTVDQGIKPEITLSRTGTGEILPVLKEKNTVTVLSKTPELVTKIPVTEVVKKEIVTKGGTTPVCIPTKGKTC